MLFYSWKGKQIAYVEDISNNDHFTMKGSTGNHSWDIRMGISLREYLLIIV